MKKLNYRRFRGKQQGFGLIEILISIGVFAVGALALAGLHTALTQSSDNSRSRTIAANIGQAEIERLRGFLVLGAGTDDSSYADIMTTSTPVVTTARGTVYSMSRVVTPYYWEAGEFTATAPDPAPLYSDFKKLIVTVAWTDPSGIDQSIVLTDVISSTSTAASGKAIAGGGKDLSFPVPYTQGERPEVAAIDLGEQRFKETLTPEPEVVSDGRDGQFVMTGFDIITFAQSEGGNRFLRREENRFLNCECTLNLNVTEPIEKTYQPLVWTGEEYIEGYLVSKPYGTPVEGRIQDPLCNTCCRDHHDPESPETDGDPDIAIDDPGRFKYDPWNSAPQHSHYANGDDGKLNQDPVTATGEVYLEACRLIRSDGFFRVAQDVKLTSLVSLPEYYLTTDEDIDEYSLYVTETVNSYMSALNQNGLYPNSTPSVGGGTLSIRNQDPPVATSLPEPLNVDTTATSQQLRSRAIYIDYLTLQARTQYATCLSGGECGGTSSQNIDSALEIIPFFEVNMTHLAEWMSDIPAEVSVTDERFPVRSPDNSYSRGVAEKIGTADVTVDIYSMLAPSNTGLTNTDGVSPADVLEAGNWQQEKIEVTVFGSGGPQPTGIIVSGEIGVQGNAGADATRVTVWMVSGDRSEQCQRVSTKYTCRFLADGNGSIVVGSYNLNAAADNAACDTSGSRPGDVLGIGSVSETTEFKFDGLPVGVTTMDIVIKGNNRC